jgi:putative tricarboxylic transport membrane protein
MSASNSKKLHRHAGTEQRVNQVVALLWIAVGIVVLIQCRGLTYMKGYGPGPGFMVFWLGVAFIVLGLALLAQVTFRPNASDSFSVPGKHEGSQLLLVMLGLFGFVFLADKIGFILCLEFLFLYLLLVVERKRLRFSLGISTLFTLSFLAIFELGLKLRLPPGLFDLLR